MASIRDEFKTEFGEFLDFNTESTDQTPVVEPFKDFRSIDEIPLDKSPLYPKIGEIVQRIKEEKSSK